MSKEPKYFGGSSNLITDANLANQRKTAQKKITADELAVIMSSAHPDVVSAALLQVLAPENGWNYRGLANLNAITSAAMWAAYKKENGGG